jgi:hypothetical protein
MPSPRELAARGGVRKVRTIKLKNGKYMHVYVMGRKGKRGGRTMAGEVQKKKNRPHA